jgi:hypothetical protein
MTRQDHWGHLGTSPDRLGPYRHILTAGLSFAHRPFASWRCLMEKGMIDPPANQHGASFDHDLGSRPR